MTDQTQLSFTPTEDLILDVLVARYRLGDTLWTFSSRNAPALRKLEKKSLVHVHSGVIENTVRASLSEHALHEHGASWFQMSITLDHPPEAGVMGPDDAIWSKPHLKALIALPQQQSTTDPRAVNAAHLLILRLINRHQPVFRISPGTDGSVVLRRWGKGVVEILADGRNYRLHSYAATTQTTTHMHEALSFMSESHG